jgi:hypothetical protein
MRLLGIAMLLAGIGAFAGPQVLAQSGVQSGPPQVQGQPGPNPGPGPSPSPNPSPGVGVDQRPNTADVGWVAVAAGFREGRWVRVGYARRGTRGEAEVAAIDACNGGPGGVRCSNAFASSSSCLFIVAGKRRGGVTWGRGSSHDVALSECRRGGYTCAQKDIIGGCPN